MLVIPSESLGLQSRRGTRNTRMHAPKNGNRPGTLRCTLRCLVAKLGEFPADQSFGWRGWFEMCLCSGQWQESIVLVLASCSNSHGRLRLMRLYAASRRISFCGFTQQQIGGLSTDLTKRNTDWKESNTLGFYPKSWPQEIKNIPNVIKKSIGQVSGYFFICNPQLGIEQWLYNSVFCKIGFHWFHFSSFWLGYNFITPSRGSTSWFCHPLDGCRTQFICECEISTYLAWCENYLLPRNPHTQIC